MTFRCGICGKVSSDDVKCDDENCHRIMRDWNHGGKEEAERLRRGWQ